MEKIKYAIYGFGLFAEDQLLPAFARCNNAELIAISKRDEKAAKKKAIDYNIPYYYSNQSIKELCDNDEIDTVFVATPNSFHKDNVIKCLNGGKHVIVEKPMAMNANQCQKMIDASHSSGNKLMVAHCMRYCSAIEYIRRRIIEGDLGKVISISADFMSTGRKSKRAWKYEKNLAGGGAAFDLGVHMIDTVRFLADSEINSTYLIKRPDPLPENAVDEYAAFILDFKNEIVGRATASYLGPRHCSIEVYGTLGYIRTLDFNKTSGAQIIEQDISGTIEQIKIKNDNFYSKEISAFSESILNNLDVPIPGEEGLKNQELIDLINNNIL